MPEPKLHHYVPKWYLRQFTDEKLCFWVWDKHTQNTFYTTPERVAAETDFYKVPELIGTDYDPLFLEKELAHLESCASRIMTQMLNVLTGMAAMDMVEISDDDRETISYYISLQFLRTAEQRDILSLFTEAVTNDLVLSAEEKINIHADLLWNGDVVHDIADRVNHSIWIFGRNETNVPFLTSDNPVTFKTHDNRMWIKAPGVLSRGTYVVFPLSPSAVLYCKDREHPQWRTLERFDKRLSPVVFTAPMVNHENAGQVFMASRFVISSKKDFSFASDFVKRMRSANHRETG